jgi:N-acetylglutamate synthase-like GNAT family acetyltransferase
MRTPGNDSRADGEYIHIKTMNVRYASPADAAFLKKKSHLPEAAILRKISLGEIIAAEEGGTLIGLCVFEYLWSRLPYISLIAIEEEYRRQGCGRAMLHFLETELRQQGHRKLYSSSQANEPEPQSWHRHVGFEECGFIADINDEGIGEIFFRKRL